MASPKNNSRKGREVDDDWRPADADDEYEEELSESEVQEHSNLRAAEAFHRKETLKNRSVSYQHLYVLSCMYSNLQLKRRFGASPTTPFSPFDAPITSTLR